ncbi:hypothetical protein K443DRAFT_677751 [Laccaria amethystina LaAM-08-1]|uniref:Uncharacterized protein n=1 Tax=Laccaria amethystina LaAM-08-1 TaxID=1095629 RepID=A0A0C9XL05_9AGAR|nr:hypothetical protein K443DRAFT_677751 [Laccaria amethystina LaAM-08-1]
MERHTSNRRTLYLSSFLGSVTVTGELLGTPPDNGKGYRPPVPIPIYRSHNLQYVSLGASDSLCQVFNC